MSDIIPPVSNALPGLWLNLNSRMIKDYFCKMNIPIRLVFQYPGGSFAVFEDEADLVAIKLRYSVTELENEIFTYIVHYK